METMLSERLCNAASLRPANSACSNLSGGLLSGERQGEGGPNMRAVD